MNRKLDLDQLSSIFGRYHDIQAVYLFGSYATDRSHAESDLDLAIVPRNSQIRAQKLDIDLQIVYEVLQNRLPDLETLRTVFAQFL